MKIYIAGKITGDQNYRETFGKVQKCYEQGNNSVLSPASLPEGMQPSDYMRVCFAMIDCADVVAFLPDWRQSKGAKLEHQYCRYIGKGIILLDDEAKNAQKGDSHETDSV